ncbi:D-glycero-beta-D-manno-heptose 1-phosphate adenylyltransferase [Micromonospora polyrhachis]|uniref:D-glycero-beta-D-manno-heptose 1-phosphate adenylyltransferase n=1 Tax=Micromonospora polyrhachis TaxID=1282883 RepID=A0A7W7SPB7_9ACTN|nr:D-glycero-beta-D-manno-heptose 1-phosphate adenylyltransferase [Micromonospora polyrhachis]MBB4958480.1 rfaE bifunctional protein nucleotidyltransferase chain/domain [Micromonospora polyrhachis]
MATGAAESGRLAAVVDDWVGRGVLVVGDAMLDEWRFADSDRLCREAPAPVLTLRRRLAAAGGAANTAVNLAALGGLAALVAPIGADAPGDELHDCLDRAGVLDRTVTQQGRATPVKRRLLAADQILIREDEGDADDELHDETIDRLLGALSCAAEELLILTDGRPPTLVVCDYGLGALPVAIRAWLVAHRDLFATVALDAHDLADWRGLAPTVVTPSFAEATRLLDVATSTRDGTGTTQAEIDVTGDRTATVDTGLDRADVAQAHLAELRERTGAEVVAVTLDGDGAIVGGADGDSRRSHATRVPASHAVGAGDAYLAAMTLALAADAPLPTAAQLAQLAATITVSDTGTCVCLRDDLLAALGSAAAPQPPAAVPMPPETVAVPVPSTAVTVPPPAATVVDHAELTTLVAQHRQAGRNIVFTNGCFDVLHRGHVRYLDQARALGDLLVVAVNSDDSVRRLKGADRPVNPVEDRVAVLAALSCVDHVVVFAEDSPVALIETVRPDVYVKGGDYPPEMVPEAPLVRRLGGQVHTLGYVPDRSTSAIIERIRSQGEVIGEAVGGEPSAPENGNRGPFLTGRPS